MADEKKEHPVPDPKRVKQQINKALIRSSQLHEEIQRLADFYRNKTPAQR